MKAAVSIASCLLFSAAALLAEPHSDLPDESVPPFPWMDDEARGFFPSAADHITEEDIAKALFAMATVLRADTEASDPGSAESLAIEKSAENAKVFLHWASETVKNLKEKELEDFVNRVMAALDKRAEQLKEMGEDEAVQDVYKDLDYSQYMFLYHVSHFFRFLVMEKESNNNSLHNITAE